MRGYLDKSKISGKARKFFLYLLRRATPRFRCRIIDGIRVARDVLFLGSGGSVPQRFLLRLPLLVSSIIMPLVSNNLNLKLPVYVFPFLDCGAWGTGALLISWEDLDSFVFVPVALIPQVTQDDHLQVQNHHDCTRIAKILQVI